MWFCSRYPDLAMDDPSTPALELPKPGPTIKSGLHFLLPVVLLIWCLMVERMSPSLSAYWAVVFMIFILLTQRPLFAFFRRQRLNGTFMQGVNEFFAGMVTGARNMIGIGIATATAGIIVGGITLTGLGLRMTEFVDFVSQGNVIAMLLFIAFVCLVLGLGVPTTANYVLVATLMVGVGQGLGAVRDLAALGAQFGDALLQEVQELGHRHGPGGELEEGEHLRHGRDDLGDGGGRVVDGLRVGERPGVEEGDPAAQYGAVVAVPGAQPPAGAVESGNGFRAPLPRRSQGGVFYAPRV